MPFPCVLSPVPAPSNSLFTSRHHVQIHHPQFSITHSPLDSLKSGFQIKCFTEDAFSDISVLLIENPMVSCQSSHLTPLQYLRQIFSPVFFFLLCLLILFLLFLSISIAYAPLFSYPSNVNISDVLYGSLFFFLHTSLCNCTYF